MKTNGKQRHLTLPYIYYWGRSGYHFIQFHRRSWISILGNRINGNVFFTILLENGKLKFIKENED
jgi:hypothetical protein